MSTAFIVTVTVACVLFVVFMVLRLTVATRSASGGVTAMFAKAAASVAFIAIAVAGLYEGAPRTGLFVLAGLVFGLIGDIVLDLKVVYLEQPEEGVYLTGGGAVQIQWKKGGADQPLQLFDAEGQPFPVRPGRTYIGVWGGVEGQSLRLLDSGGAEQPLPEAPAPMGGASTAASSAPAGSASTAG